MPQRITDRTCLVRDGGAGADSVQTRELTARGRVAVPAPTSESDALMVVIPDLSETQGYIVPAGNWNARSGGALPTVGATCLMVFDHLGDVWVPVWSNA
jgi:hypothetical protein